MKNAACVIVLFMAAVTAPVNAPAMNVVTQFPTFDSHVVRTTDPMSVVFDQSLNIATVDDAGFFVTPLGQENHVTGNYTFATTFLANDTAVFTPMSRWDWGRRYKLQITGNVESENGDPFAGALPADGIFAANIPDDFFLPVYDPSDPFAIMVDSTVFMGYNPIDPEADAQPWEIPGLNVTGGWKYTRGRSDVIVAIVDDGMRNYSDGEIRRAFFLNQGELPLPNVSGVTCTQYDCNGDGRFDVDDYANDDRVLGTPPYSAHDLILSFSDGVDGDGNGLVDDISGWDFFRGVNEAIGVDEFPEGTHGGGRVELIAAQGNNGIGDLPGVCPECRVLTIRANSNLIYDYNIIAAGVRYATSMGASVITFAGVNLTWSESAHQSFVDAMDAGALTVAASGDEMTYHHWMPAAGEDVLSVKTIFPMAPVELFSFINLGLFGFTETYCTNYGTHTHLSIPADTGCSSDSTGILSGMLGLLKSYGLERGYNLTADELKQIATMTAYDIKDHCATLVNLLDVCQEGYDEHFAYGRPDMVTALKSLGDPDFGIDPAIPPTVRVSSPKWWQTVDPARTPDLQVIGKISSRVTPYHWEVQIAKGREPLDNEYQTVASGTETEPIDGLIATVPIHQVISDQWATGVPQNQYSFEVTLRVRASYAASGERTVAGESRKSIGVHIDNDPQTGLVPGFPMDIGASGESSPILYDLDGDPDHRLEIVFGGGDGKVYALKYSETAGQWQAKEGFPIDLSGDDAWVADGIFASLAVGDLFGDGTPEIVAATLGGKVFALDPKLAPSGNSVLPGFPVSADDPDNSSPLAFGYGNGFLASPVLADMDGDGMLEIVAASTDQKTYAWKPRGLSGRAEQLQGWPVLCRSDSGLVPPDKVCGGNSLPSQILGTPAVGILDPASDDPDIAARPAVVVATTESCDGPLMSQTRIYAIFHDGMNHAGGPFLPDWPAMPLAPLGNSIPIPLAAGSSASPAVIVGERGADIAVGSAAWIPELIHYTNGRAHIKEMPVAVAVNAVGSPSFSSLRNDGAFQYVIPLTGVIRINDLGFQLFNSRMFAMNLEAPHTKVLEGEVEDIPMLTASSVADLDNDGEREVIAGTGGYLVHAFSPRGGESADWPKYTQKWVAAAPAIGDMDNDGFVEIVVQTREGVLYAWKSPGDNCPDGALNSDWRRFHHDERNTGFYGVDTLPPSRVTDLAAQELSDGRLRLMLTATGDDWMCGTAASYDIRYTDEESADLSNPSEFDQATPVAVSERQAFFPGGLKQTLIVTAPGAMHFALRAADAAGNLSQASNDAAVQPPIDDDAINDDTDDDTESRPKSNDSGDERQNNGCGCSMN